MDLHINEQNTGMNLEFICSPAMSGSDDFSFMFIFQNYSSESWWPIAVVNNTWTLGEKRQGH